MKFVDRNGFTLVEIMVALVILMVGIILAVRVGTEASRINRITQKGTKAQPAASQFYELFSVISPSDTILQDDGDQNDLDNITSPDHRDSVKINLRWYPVVWNVADNRLGSEVKNGYKTIKIHVLNPAKKSEVLYSTVVIRGMTQ